MLPRVNGV